jgi:hypothetical protein
VFDKKNEQLQEIEIGADGGEDGNGQSAQTHTNGYTQT